MQSHTIKNILLESSPKRVAKLSAFLKRNKSPTVVLFIPEDADTIKLGTAITEYI